MDPFPETLGLEMAITLDDVEKRLTAIEQELTRLAQLVQQTRLEETPAQRAVRLRLEAELSHPALVASWQRSMKEMGIVGEPIPAEKLQEMMRAEGIKPEDNEFSRELIAMREE
jgi:hypothetical protein